MLMDRIHREHWLFGDVTMFLQVSNGDKEDWRLTYLTFFLLSLLFIYFGSPLGHVSLAKPIATLKCSLQLPNQRRCLNQWGGWILTGICNEHQPVGIDVSSPLCVCIHEALKSFRPSPGRIFLSWSRRSTFGKDEICKGVNESSNPPRNRSTKSTAFVGQINLSILRRFNWSCGSITATMKAVWGEAKAIDLDFTN